MTVWNDVLILTDDQEAETLDLQATPFISSLDSVYGGVVRFPNGGISSPRCNAARAGLFSGQRADRNGVVGNNDKPTWNQHIQLPFWVDQAGGRFGLSGKYLNPYPWVDYPGKVDGADFWRGTGELTSYGNWVVRDEVGSDIVSSTYGGPSYFTDACRDWALEFLDGSASDSRPFCLFITPYAPHEPYAPAQRHQGMDAGGSVDSPEFNVRPNNAPQWHLDGYPLLSTAQQGNARTDRKQSRRAMRAVDELVRAVFEKLEAIGKLNTTRVWIATDNGYGHGRHCVYSSTADQKRNPYWWCITPGIMRVRHPLAQNRIAPEACTQLDITASIVANHGLTRADVITMSGHDIDGRDLEPIIMNTATTWPDVQEFYHIAQTPVPLWWVGLDWQADLHYQDFPVVTQKALYDRKVDPRQLENVVGDSSYSADLTRMQGILAQLQADPHARDDQPRPVTEILSSILKNKFGQPVNVHDKAGRGVEMRRRP